MTVTVAILLFMAGFFGGGLNAIIGGGSFIAFPILVFFGLPPIAANATTTASLWSGTLASLWVQRKDIVLGKKFLPLFIILGLAGGMIGSLISINTSSSDYTHMIPYMMLMAAALFTWHPQITNLIHRLPIKSRHSSILYWIIISIAQLLISIYGGFFGAAMGIMFIAFFMIIGIKNIHEANALRNCSMICINLTAAIIYGSSGNVSWIHVIFICSGGIIGGYLCAHYIRNLSEEIVRKALVAIAWVMTIAIIYSYSVS